MYVRKKRLLIFKAVNTGNHWAEIVVDEMFMFHPEWNINEELQSYNNLEGAAVSREKTEDTEQSLLKQSNLKHLCVYLEFNAWVPDQFML